MAQLNLALKEVILLAESMDATEISISYDYHPAVPADVIQGIEAREQEVKLESVKNEFGEEIIDKLDEKVLDLLRRISLKDVQIALSRLSDFDIDKVGNYETSFKIQLGDNHE